MSFAVSLAPDLHFDGEYSYYFGTIHLGDEVEHFRADATSLSRSDYQHLWLDALQLILTEEQPSALVTSMSERDASTINFFEGWVMYPFQNLVLAQNRMFFVTGDEDLTTASGIASLAGEYTAANDDGEEISTWQLKTDNVRFFYVSEMPTRRQPEGAGE